MGRAWRVRRPARLRDAGRALSHALHDVEQESSPSWRCDVARPLEMDEARSRILRAFPRSRHKVRVHGVRTQGRRACRGKDRRQVSYVLGRGVREPRDFRRPRELEPCMRREWRFVARNRAAQWEVRLRAHRMRPACSPDAEGHSPPLQRKEQARGRGGCTICGGRVLRRAGALFRKGSDKGHCATRQSVFRPRGGIREVWAVSVWNGVPRRPCSVPRQVAPFLRLRRLARRNGDAA